jgi:anti-sigma factor RsiW
LDQNHDYEDTCTRYLLGELTEAEQERFEKAFFGDDQLFERFLAIKDELVDSYARDELTGRAHERFKQHFMSTPPRRERVNKAREFIRAVSALTPQESRQRAKSSQSKSGTSPWQSFLGFFGPGRLVAQGALVVLLLLAIGGSLIVFKRQRERAERLRQEAAARQQKEEQNARPVGPAPTSGLGIGGQRDSVANSQPTPAAASPAQSQNTNKQAPVLAARVASLSLIPYASRANDSTPVSLKLGPEIRLVRLSLIFRDDDYRNYSVTIRTVAGEQVVHQQRLKAQKGADGKRVNLTFDASILRGQDYIITLNGLTPDGKLEPLNDYHLRVEHNPR